MSLYDLQCICFGQNVRGIHLIFVTDDVINMQTHTRKKTGSCGSSPASFSTFPHQTHDHSVCIRPPLPAFNVTAQNAVFQLEGSFVSFSVLSQVWLVDIVIYSNYCMFSIQLANVCTLPHKTEELLLFL